MRKDKRLRKKYAYVQDFGTYTGNFIVAAGMSNTEILAWMRRNKLDQKLMKDFEEDSGMDNWVKDDYDGMVWNMNGHYLLWLKEWYNNWNCHDTLMHECHHLVHFTLAESRQMSEEKEAQAYQQEFLVKNIRHKLTKAFYG